MSRRAAVAELSARRLLESLVSLRDEIGVAKDLAAASCMACHALDRASGERSALCAVTIAAREQLEAVLARLDEIIAARG